MGILPGRIEIIRGRMIYNFRCQGPEEMKELGEKLSKELSGLIGDSNVFYGENGVRIEGNRHSGHIQIAKIGEDIAEVSLYNPKDQQEWKDALDSAAEIIKNNPYVSENNA